MNIIDTHTDTITTLMNTKESLQNNSGHISLDKLCFYEKKGIYFSIWLSKQKKLDPYFETKKAINFYFNEINKNKHLISHANTFNEFINIFNSKKIASLLCIEGGEALDGNIENLQNLYNLGVRLLTITWNNDNALGSGVLGQNIGLTNLGKEVVLHSNNSNMILDISHLNTLGFYDVLELSTKPVIASHSNCYSIYSTKRNLSDEQLKALHQTKSYVSFTLHSPFINGINNCNEKDILLHIEHLITILGEDYVSFGSDFDGTNSLPCEINSICDLSTLYNLIEKTYNKTIANKIFYENQLNFLKKVL